MAPRVLILLTSFVALAGCATTAAERTDQAEMQAKTTARLDKALAGLTPGEQQQCISQIQLRNAGTTHYGKTILYRVDNDLVYRTDTSGGCYGLGQNDALVTRSYTGQLCSGDIVQTVQPTTGSFTGSCTLGPFVRYSKGR